MPFSAPWRFAPARHSRCIVFSDCASDFCEIGQIEARVAGRFAEYHHEVGLTVETNLQSLEIGEVIEYHLDTQSGQPG